MFPLLATILVLACAPDANARSTSGGGGAGGRVTGVSPSKLLVATGRTTQTYTVTPSTSVTVNGKPGKVTAIRQGMHVSVTQSGGVATAIHATSPKIKRHRGRR